MSDLFNRVKQKVDENLYSAHTHFVQDIVGNSMESSGATISNNNHEAFKALCEILDEELHQIKKLCVVMDTIMKEQRDIFLQLQENLFEKGFLTKDEMVIK